MMEQLKPQASAVCVAGQPPVSFLQEAASAAVDNGTRRIRFEADRRPAGADADIAAALEFAQAAGAGGKAESLLTMEALGSDEGSQQDVAEQHVSEHDKAMAGWGKMRTGMQRMTERCAVDIENDTACMCHDVPRDTICAG